MNRDTAYAVGRLVAQKRAADESETPKPDAAPEQPAAAEDKDPFSPDERSQFMRFLGMSPEDMQSQQLMRLAMLGRTAPMKSMAQSIRQMFSPLGGA